MILITHTNYNKSENEFTFHLVEHQQGGILKPYYQLSDEVRFKFNNDWVQMQPSLSDKKFAQIGMGLYTIANGNSTYYRVFVDIKEKSHYLVPNEYVNQIFVLAK